MDSRAFFAERVRRCEGEDVFHYCDEWMDRYAWELRTTLFDKHVGVRGLDVADFGCGSGRWLERCLAAGARSVVGVEQGAEIAAVARRRLPTVPIFDCGADHHALPAFLGEASCDLVLMITSFMYCNTGRLRMLRNAGDVLRNGGRLVMIDWLSDHVPLYQQGHPHKDIWTLPTVLEEVAVAGFHVVASHPLSWVDTSVFHYLGKNWLAYQLTCALERLTPWVPQSLVKYRLLILEVNRRES